MKKHLKEAKRIVDSNLILVPVLAAVGIYTSGGDGSILHYLVASVVIVVITTATYGRLAGSCTGDSRTSYITLIKRYWFTYLKVFLIVSILLLVFPLMKGLHKDPLVGSIAMVALSVGINIMAIYIAPYVFLENKALPSFDKGIKFLMRNFVYSLPLIFLTLLIYLLKGLLSFGRPLLDYHLQPSVASFIIYVLSISFALNVILAYLSLIVFTAACLVLVEKAGVENKTVTAEPGPASAS